MFFNLIFFHNYYYLYSIIINLWFFPIFINTIMTAIILENFFFAIIIQLIINFIIVNFFVFGKSLAL